MKVFCIGAWKSGTTSIGMALDYLMPGAHKGWGHREEYLAKNYKKILNISERYATFDDTPWNTKEIIPLISKKYPDAKFILPIRDSEEWIQSVIKWYFDDITNGKAGQGPVKQMALYEDTNHSIVAEIYSRQMSPKYDAIKLNPISENKDKWINWYEDRNANLIKSLGKRVTPIYFSKSNPLTWEPICKALSKPIPNRPFPRLNVQSNK